MPKIKKNVVVILLLLGCGWLVIEWLDWSRLAGFAATGRWEEYLLSRRIKLALSVMVAVLVWTTGRAALSNRDRGLMCAAFGAVVLADVAFYLGNYYFGIGFFSVAQLVFIIRHGAGVVALVQRGWSRMVLQLLVTAFVTGIVNFIILKLLFVPHAAHPMFPVIAGYSIFLCCSLWTGIACGIAESLPKVNSRFVAAGVVILYLGDLMVGLNIILPHDRWYIISTSLTWFFYLPAITLLALSGYRWEE